MSRSLVCSILLLSPLLASSFSQQRGAHYSRFVAAPQSNGLLLSQPIGAKFGAAPAPTDLLSGGSLTQLFSSPADSSAVEVEPASDAQSDDGAKPMVLSTKAAVAAGILLALTSGFVNGACVTGTFSASQATAAVTGTWTNCAVAAARSQYAKFTTLAKYLFSFMAGSAIAGLLVPEPEPFEVSNSKGVAYSFGVGALALSVAGQMAKTGGLSSESILILCFIANGIQNSLTSSLTANLCRTTHFSGITSDIGTFLGQNLRGNRANLLKLQVFPMLAAAFWTGSFIAYPLTVKFASNVLFAAATVYGGFSLSLLFFGKK